MRSGMENVGFESGRIYTLAQSGTETKRCSAQFTVISGEGVDIANNHSLANRTKRKVITKAMVLSLIDISKEKEDLNRVQSYWNTYHCIENLISSDGKLYGKYCKNRFCTICNSIRKAEMINKYYSYLSKWPDPHFVTLTVKACKEGMLNNRTTQMLKAFKLLQNRCKKRNQRGQGIRLMGIKSLECNFNPDKQTYNPHFHIIVPNKEIAELLKDEWIKTWRPIPKETYRYKYTTPKAQHIEPIVNLETALIEIIKYGSKIFTEPDLNRKCAKKTQPIIYARALDNIFVAMKGKRIFERFGFNLPNQIQRKSKTRIVYDFKNWTFSDDASDWVNLETGEVLTGYVQPPELNYLLNNCINTCYS